MAATQGYRWVDALEVNKAFGHRAEVSDQQVTILNKACYLLWSEFPWRCYLRRIPPFWLTPGVSIYGYPYYAFPTELYSIHQASIWDCDNEIKEKDLVLLRNRQEESDSDWLPDVITYEPSNISLGNYRFYPRVGEDIPSCTYQVRGYYKRIFDRIDNDNIASIGIPYEHCYYPVICKAVLWAILDQLQHEKAGTVQINSEGQEVFTGVLGQYKSMVKQMKADASLAMGNETISPGDSAFYSYR